MNERRSLEDMAGGSARTAEGEGSKNLKEKDCSMSSGTVQYTHAPLIVKARVSCRGEKLERRKSCPLPHAR